MCDPTIINLLVYVWKKKFFFFSFYISFDKVIWSFLVLLMLAFIEAGFSFILLPFRFWWSVLHLCLWFLVQLIYKFNLISVVLSYDLVMIPKGKIIGSSLVGCILQLEEDTCYKWPHPSLSIVIMLWCLSLVSWFVLCIYEYDWRFPIKKVWSFLFFSCSRNSVYSMCIHYCLYVMINIENFWFIWWAVLTP